MEPSNFVKFVADCILRYGTPLNPRAFNDGHICWRVLNHDAPPGNFIKKSAHGEGSPLITVNSFYRVEPDIMWGVSHHSERKPEGLRELDKLKEWSNGLPVIGYVSVKQRIPEKEEYDCTLITHDFHTLTNLSGDLYLDARRRKEFPADLQGRSLEEAVPKLFEIYFGK